MPTYDSIEDTTTAAAASGNNISNWTVDDIRKSDILVFRESATEYVDTVIAPNGFQVGLLDEAFLTDLLVTGHITGSGVIYAELGFSGSLQTLTNGNDYLVGAGGISITNNEDGSITISGSGAGGSGSRIKEHVVLTGTVLALNPVSTATELAPYSYSDQVIDVFLNGDLLLQGSASDVNAGNADFYLMNDVNGSGQIVFRFDLTTSDELILIAGTGGGGGGEGTTYTAGSGLNLSLTEFSASTDNTTIGTNTSGQLKVLRTPGTLTNGNGIEAFTYTGATNNTIRVKPVAGGPITVTGAGVGLDFSPLQALSLVGTDEVIISKDGTLAKTTIADIVALSNVSGGAPTNAAYLVASHTSDLTSERVLAAGSGISITDGGANSSMTVTALLETNGGLRFVSGKMAVNVADFAGFGLSESLGTIAVNSSVLAGTGLVAEGNALAVDFTQVAAASNKITISAGDGLALGGTAQLGNAVSQINLEVDSSDIKGLGLSVSNNDLNVFLSGAGGINILSGSSGELIIDGTSLQSTGDISSITAGIGLVGGGTSGDITLDVSGLTVDQFDGSSIIASGETFVDNDSVLLTGAAINDLIESKGYIDSVVAGAGLIGGGTTGTVTLTVSNLTLSEMHPGIITTSTETFVDNDQSLLTAAAINDLIESKGYTDGSNINVGVTEVIAGSGLQGGGNAGSITVQIDYDDGSNVVMDAYDPAVNWEIDETNDKIIVYDADQQRVIKISPSQFSGGAGKIGDAEDGSYEDGLFTDFTPETPTGTAIDRFNEILKALAPPPAPELSSIDEDVVNGIDAYLSFGTSNTTTYTNVVAIGGESSKDINELYSYDNSGNNIKLGIYDGTQVVQGTLNDQVLENLTSPSNLTNYSADAFKDGDVGSLVLELNGTDFRSVDLAAFSSGDYLIDNTGFYNISAATSAKFDSGVQFDTFKHRTASYRVDPVHQVNGFNYVRVKHVKGVGNIASTNYIMWINDSDNVPLSVSGEDAIFVGSDTVELSGVRYFGTGEILYTADIDNLYRYVYDLTPITLSTTSSGVLSGLSYSPGTVTRTTIGPGETHLKAVQISKNSTVNAQYILGGSINTRLSVTHPLKNPLTNAGNVTVDEILLWSIAPSSTNLSELFDDEIFRIQSGDYNLQSDVTANSWDSSVHMTNGGYANGLQVYYRTLKSPIHTLNGGNFSTLQNGPIGNPDYSGQTGTISYYRKFQNNGGTVHDISYTINSSGTQVSQATPFSTSNFKVSFKLPSNGTDDSGWLDAASPFSYQNTADGDGGYIGTFNGTTGVTRYVTWGTGSIQNGDYVVMKVEADASWTGNIDSISFNFGATGNVNPSSNLDTININQTANSTNANLSFGDTLSLANYSTVEATAGNTEKNTNEQYSSTATRLGVIGPTRKTITGVLNWNKTGSGNSYPVNAFGGINGNRGVLKLYLNGNLVHSVDLSIFNNGPSFNGANGFELTSALVGKDSNNLPNYEYWYRTGTYTVGTTNQREGWNYIQVIHTVDGVDYDTNFMEWVNDSSNPSLSYADLGFDGITDTNISWLSGVKYFESPSGQFKYRASNVYKYVYSPGNAIVLNGSNVTITNIEARNDGNTLTNIGSSCALPPLDPTVLLAYDTDLYVTGSFDFTRSSSIPGKSSYSVGISSTVSHPLVNSLSIPNQTLGPFLVSTINDSSSAASENFSGETWRLQDTTFVNQAAIASYPWDSTQNLITGTSTHNTGLIVYGDELRYPTQAGLASDKGDFRDVSETGPLVAPLGNPDYSGATGLRTYLRKIQNTSGQSQSNFDITITGSGNISTVAIPSGDEIKVFIGLPETPAGFTTGFLDLGVDFATNQYADGDGCLLGSLDNTLNATNRATLGVNPVGDDEYIIIKIVAPATWSGYISGISVSWG